MLGLIDTHCHLQVDDFDDDLSDVVARARAAGVADIVICAGSADDWAKCARIAHKEGLSYMLGIHPLFVPAAREEDLQLLETKVREALADPHFVGLGEIGLEGLTMPVDEKQERFFAFQMKLAVKFSLPCSVHVRKSASRLLYYMRRIPATGVVHAFNGSDVERDGFIKLGWKLGFGGAATYEGSLRIRRHLSEVPDEAWVLETDAPDMPSSDRRDRGELRTEPADILATAALAARLRGVTTDAVIEQTRQNALAIFSRLARS